MSDEEALAAEIAEIDARLAELEDQVAEYEAHLFVRDLLYLEEEGFIEIEHDVCFPAGEACHIDT